MRELSARGFAMLPASCQSWVIRLKRLCACLGPGRHRQTYVAKTRRIMVQRRYRQVWPGRKAVEDVESVQHRYRDDGHTSCTRWVGKVVRHYAEDSTVHWVDPAKIVYTAGVGLFKMGIHKGWVMDGDWDRHTKLFEDFDICSSLRQRVLMGIPWNELPFYHRALKQIEAGIPVNDCITAADLDQRCDMLDGLFSEIKTGGYKTQSDLHKEGCRYNLDDEIIVNIGRDGDILFCCGKHRLACAKIAGVPRVPVRIQVRHAEWEELKRRIHSYAAAKKKKGKIDAVYAPLTHIDLQSIPSTHSHQQFEIIRGNIDRSNKTILDIGAHWGYFCHRFEEEGFQCFAVEDSEQHLYFLQKLKRAENREFTIIAESIFDLGERGPLKYDIVLALSVFHHFLKEEHSFRRLKTLLGNLDTNEMFFEPHLHSSPQMAGAFVNLAPEQFVQFILDNSRLNKFELLGLGETRPLYKLWR